MKPRSIKTRITLWITLLVVVLFSLMLLFAFSMSSSVVQRTARQQLADAVRANAALVSFADGQFAAGEGFAFSRSGVSCLVYSKAEALLAGQLPVGFSASVPFENGTLRTVESSGGDWYLLDLWVADGWENGVWLRGLMEVPDVSATARNLLLAAAVALPLFVLAGALGCYFILRRSLRGLDAVNAAASSIGEGKDLSRRIGPVPGGRELTQLAENFDGLLERLQRSFEAERRFTADASHELRTPVSIIKSACEYAEAFDETDEERRETLGMIHRQADKMAGLIGQLLALTRLDQGTETLRPVPLDLGQLARRTLEDQNYDAARLRLALAEGVTVKGDEALLGRLAANLVDNAFKYGLPGGTVTVEVRAENGEALLTVADEGPGIPAGQQEKIWQRFYQVDAARGDQQEGVGLGLSLVQRIAQLHGGRMTLKSAEGAPSAFTLHLPLA
ncbi:MAG TPA: HAMP domain-containing histidine kinase [Candidatus Fournierella pullicola]|uniref:histidine kinase n=1 Tax=Candidatus Allofournierella pullicola TaxID=2838596 RepID=A0A9D1V2Y0_9FIRM|nr:HAMP domain-containing histidine kinase [Candidatus Fournierella pullicola]